MAKHLRKSLCAALLTSFIATPLLADTGSLYVSGKIGGSREYLHSIKNNYPGSTDTLSKTKHDETVWAFGAAVGYRFNELLVPVRIEVDYTYRDRMDYHPEPLFVGGTSTFKSNINSQTILGAGYVDIPITNMFSVFLGGGLGVGMNEAQNKLTDGSTITRHTSDKNEFAWMATAGFSVIPADWFAMDVSYRYSDLGSVEMVIPDSTLLKSDSYTANEIFLTLRFTLPSMDSGVNRYRTNEYAPRSTKGPSYVNNPPPQPVKQSPKMSGKGPAYNGKSPQYQQQFK